MNDTLYREELLEHYKHPHNRKTIAKPDFAGGDYNPSCGDRITMEGTITNGKITDLGFGGSGCVISQATASLLTECCTGKTVDDVLAFTKDDIMRLINIELGPTRMKCALLSLFVLQHALQNYKTKKQS